MRPRPAPVSGGLAPFYLVSAAMKMNQTARRILSLSAFALAIGVTSATQAGIIPWVYDSIFGPVRYSNYGYAPYSVSYAPRGGCCGPSYAYSEPRRSNECSPCSTSYYAPVYYAPASGCGQVTMAPSCGSCQSPISTSGNCLSGCGPTASAPVAAPAKSGFVPSKSNATNKSPDTSTKVLAPTKTFEEPEVKTPGTSDGLGGGGRARGVRQDSEIDEASGTTNEAFKPATPGEIESTVPAKTNKAKTPPADSIDVFEKPIEFNKDDSSEATIQRRPRPALDLDSKIAWRAEPQRTRIPFHAKVVKVQVARRIPTVDTNWTPVASKPIGTQLVRK